MAAKNPDRAASVLPIPEWDRWMADHPDITVPLPDGSTISVPPPERWPDEAMEFISENPDKPIGLVKLVLSEDDRRRVAESGANSTYVLTRIGEASGVDMGKSSASSGS